LNLEQLVWGKTKSTRWGGTASVCVRGSSSCGVRGSYPWGKVTKTCDVKTPRSRDFNHIRTIQANLVAQPINRKKKKEQKGTA